MNRHHSTLSFDQLLTTPVANEPESVSQALRPQYNLPITCLDGTTLSVQAGASYYSQPQSNVGPWVAVEVGSLSVEPGEAWEPYFNGGVYANVPVALVRAFIAQHGGEAVRHVLFSH